jgi:hypothetical protein
VPEGWRVQRADIKERALDVDERGTVNLTGLKGFVSVRVSVARTK